MPEPKARIQRRLEADGRWRAFVSRREQLKAEGHAPSDAWQLAALEFPPGAEDGGPVSDSPAMEGKGEPAPAATPAPNPSPPEPPPEPKLARDLGAGKKATPVTVPDRFEMSRFVAEAVNERDEARWVAAHICVSDVTPEMAPSSAAFAMLSWVQSSRLNESSFWEKIYPRLFPSQSQIDRGERFKDDGRAVFDLIDKCLKYITSPGPDTGEVSLLSPGSEDDGSEP